MQSARPTLSAQPQTKVLHALPQQTKGHSLKARPSTNLYQTNYLACCEDALVRSVHAQSSSYDNSLYETLFETTYPYIEHTTQSRAIALYSNDNHHSKCSADDDQCTSSPNRDNQAEQTTTTELLSLYDCTFTHTLHGMGSTRSKQYSEVLNRASKFAAFNVVVLLGGESGCGKTFIAKAIHENSQRSGKRFLHLNCAGLQDSLFASEMFGHKRGGFTDAKTDKKGMMDLASGGTLFLDEVGELSLSCQKSLLTAVENQTFIPVGGVAEVKTDVRFIFATNKILGHEVSAGRFREDLYYRIKGNTLTVPPLRDRIEDFEGLLLKFTKDFCTEHNLQEKYWDPSVIHSLMSYRWPGNIREVKSFVEHVIMLTDGLLITTEDVKANAPDEIREFLAESDGRVKKLSELTDAEFAHELFHVCKGSGKEMARVFGVSPSAVSQQKTKRAIK